MMCFGQVCGVKSSFRSFSEKTYILSSLDLFYRYGYVYFCNDKLAFLFVVSCVKFCVFSLMIPLFSSDDIKPPMLVFHRTGLGRARAWLHLALMQKKVADYLKVLINRKDLLG